MKRRFLSIIGLLISLTAYSFIYGCGSRTVTYPVTQIRFYVDDSLYEAVIVRSDSFIMPVAPQKEGYAFKGWYCDTSYETEFKADKYASNKSRYDIDVYAKFEEDPSNIQDEPSIYNVLCQI